MKYLTLAMAILSFSILSVMTTDLIMSGNNWGIIMVLYYVGVAVSAYGFTYAHISFLRMFRIRNRRNS